MSGLARAGATNKDWGQLGPAMKALPNNRYRAFVEFYLLENPVKGAQTNAARRAGFGTGRSLPITMAKIASRLMRDDRIVAAIAEETRKLVRAGAPEAVKALMNLVRDSEHKDHVRGIAMIINRVDPEIARADVHVTHKIIDPDVEALEELRALRQLGTSRDKLLELFGANGLERIEHLDAAEKSRRAVEAKVIDGEAIEVADGQR
jgi:phage terminase small subunit